MVIVRLGYDTYGKVKTVGLTPVVTRFAMVSAIPIFPRESYYYVGERVPEGIPLVSTAKKINGLPLARLDLLSVIVAYARGFFGVLTLVGCIGFITLIAGNSGPQRLQDGVVSALLLAGSLCLCVGAGGGVLTYFLPFQITERERQIRLASGLALGICADLALVHKEVVRAVASEISKPRRGERAKRDPGDGAPDEKCHELLRQLVMTRAKIALGEDPQPLEGQTDDLLHQIQLAMGE